MTRFECLELLVPLITDQFVVTSLSGQKVEWGHLSNHEGNLFIGSMGNALAVGLGLSLVLPHRKVIVLESDGSLLLSLFNLPTLANLDPANLIVLVFDNEAYSGTRISHPSATAKKTDLAAVARGSGIEDAATIRDLQSFRSEVCQGRQAGEGEGVRRAAHREGACGLFQERQSICRLRGE